ncbi:MAG TPA: HDOD domain-containing protein [Candidatus Hydrogenedentes bacterium]|nr:HDOD domain-containing protein [Candidatus Hydrogenedentota bacterium]HQH54558.1 HDOD domain-containing protein [Candidatus Hydrogenedentota bacterium]
MNTCAYCEGPADIRRGMGVDAEVYLYACPLCLNVSLLRSQPKGLLSERLETEPDIREILPAGSIPSEILNRLRKAADDLPLLPEVCQRVVSLAHDPLSTMTDIAEAINQDPVIATKLLRLANSVAFGGLHEITSLDQACARLGVREIVRTVQAIAYSGLYRAAKPSQRETLQALWRHTVAASQAAYEIARQKCPEEADEMFLAGLLHDLGAVVLINIIARSPVTLSSRLREEPTIAHEFEVKYHALAGIHVVLERNLPNTFAFTTYFHPRPQHVPVPQSRTPVLIVRMAERVAEACGYAFDGGDEPLGADDPEAAELGLSSEDLERVQTRVHEAVETLLDIMAA